MVLRPIVPSAVTSTQHVTARRRILRTAAGLSPMVMAERVLEGIKEGRFYLLSDEAWWQAANTRLEDIRLGRNPTFAPPISQ